MKKAKFAAIIVFLLFLVPAGLSAYDIGVVLNQDAGISGGGDKVVFDYDAVLIPRFSMLLDDTKDIFISVGLSFNYENEEPVFAFELLRTEFNWVLDKLKLSIGRTVYTDPLDFVAEGLFDGVQAFYDIGMGTLNVGILYSGLVYKKTNKITITEADIISFYAPVDSGNIGDTYFASKRLVMALGWEHPALADKLIFNAALSGQVDVNDADNPYHSQYASVKAVMLLDRFMFGLGGCMQLSQTPEAVDKSGIAFAGEIGAAWSVPTPFQSQLSLNGIFTSGGTDDAISAFVPITVKDQGSILQASISGLSVVYLDYLARLHQTYSAGLGASLFLRSDKGTYNGYPNLTTNDGHFLGTELFGRFVWSPVSDLLLNLGGGVFMPSVKAADPMWRIELSLLMALY